MTLREQVAEAIAAADKGAWEASGHAVIVAGELDQADAAIRVVLAAAAEQIEALGTDWTIIRAGETRYEPAKAVDFKREALAAVARLSKETS